MWFCAVQHYRSSGVLRFFFITIKTIRIIFLTIFPYHSNIFIRNGFVTVQSYDSSGVLVSFFIFTKSYKYKLPSDACLTSISIRKIFIRSISPLSRYIGNANRDVKRYHPYFASIPCLFLKFSCQRLFFAISFKSNILY